MPEPSSFAAAQLQRDIAAEDTLMKLRSLAKRGYWTGGPPPYGYDRIKVIDEDGRQRSKLTINEKEAKIVREIFDLFLKGSSMKEIAKLLNSKGIKTKKGKNWDTNYIAHILRNEKYTGKLIYGKGTKKNHRIQREDMIIVPGAISAIIPEKIFLQVQKKLLLLPKYHTKNAYPYLLSGIAYCQHGHKMIGYKKRAPYYYCKKCGYRVNAKKAENSVINYIKHIVLTNIDFEKLANEINAQLQEQFLQENAHQSYLMEEKEKLQKELDRIINAIKAGGHIKTLTEEAIKIENQLDQINAKLSQTKKVLKKIAPEQLREKREKKYKPLCLIQTRLPKKEVIHEIVDRVILYKDGFVEIRMRGM